MIEVLGQLRVSGGDRPVAIRSRLQRALLAALVVDRGRFVSVDRLVDAIWRDDLPDNPEAALHSQVSRLRRILPDGVRIDTDAGGYRLVVPEEALDVARFEAAWATVRSAPQRERLALVDDALSLWRGEPYAELDDDRSRAEASRLDELRASMLESRAEALLELGSLDDAIADLERLRHEYPLRDRVIELAMRALAAAGRVPDALRLFAAHRERLVDELGLDPSPALCDLEMAILRSEPDPTIGRPSPIASRLPRSASSFVGRVGDVGAIVDAVRAHRIVTLTGPGGVGKTRLALEAAHRLPDAFPDGLAFVELSEIDQERSLVELLASSLDIQPQSDTPMLRRICDVLESRRVLLVVDNCEHVIDAAASLIADVVGATQHVHVLATSRERLNIDGEHCRPVEPLPVEGSAAHPDDAVALFRDRATAVRPDFVLDARSAPLVADLCRTLDGLPLAIELAAARLTSLSLEEVVAGLDERFTLLRGGHRTASRRQSSLWDVVDWSYRQLDPHLADLLVDLSVFAGTFTAHDAAVVARQRSGGRAASPSALAELVERSLLVASPVPGAPTRYGLLETVRAFARDRLASGGLAVDAADRHADWATRLAEDSAAELVDGREAAANRRLADAIAELRAAHLHLLERGDHDRAFRLASALRRWAWARLHAEVMAWAEATADRFAGVDHPAAAATLSSASTGAWQRGDLSAARRLADAAIAAAPTDPTALEALGDVDLLEGRLADARRNYRDAVERATAAGDDFPRLVNLGNVILACGYAGDVADATDLARVARAGAPPSPTLQAWLDYCEGEALVAHDPARALHLLRRSVDLADSSGARFISGVAGLTWTTTRLRSGAPGDDLHELTVLLRAWQQDRLWTQEWTALRAVIELLATVGESSAAARLLGAMEASRFNAGLFGSDAERLDGVRRALERSLGPAVGDEIAVGRALGDDEAVDLAVDRLNMLAADGHERGDRDDRDDRGDSGPAVT